MGGVGGGDGKRGRSRGKKGKQRVSEGEVSGRREKRRKKGKK